PPRDRPRHGTPSLSLGFLMASCSLSPAVTQERIEECEWPVARACRFLSVVLVALVAIYPFLGSGGYLFTNYDDDVNFKENLSFRGMGPAQIHWAWETTLLGVYQPLAWMLLELEYTMGGIRPWGYHLTSIFLHAACCVALLFLTHRLITWKEPDRSEKSPIPAWVASALAVGLFAAHPLRTEVVAWVSCQPYLPCALFGILCVLAYLKAVQCHDQGRSAAAWSVASVVLLVSSLLCKPLTVGLPLVLIILDWLLLGRFTSSKQETQCERAWRVCAEKIPFLLVSLPFMFIACLVSDTHGAWKWAQVGIGPRIAQAVSGTWLYLGKTIWPANLSPFNPRPTGLSLTDSSSLAALGAFLVGAAGSLSFRRRFPAFLAAWSAYLVFLAPVSGLVMCGSMITCDRYSYIATMPLTVLLALGLLRLADWQGGEMLFRGAIAVGLIGAIILAARSTDQCEIWADPESLWQSAVRRDAPIPEIYVALGTIYRRQGKTDDAIRVFRKSLAICPNSPECMVALAEQLALQGDETQAIDLLNRALKLPFQKPAFRPIAHQMLADFHLKQGHFQQAVDHFQFLIRLDPWQADLHRKLSRAYELWGHGDDAVREKHLADEIADKQREKRGGGDQPEVSLPPCR
ncbi:MAG: tetratricopeptide repeat protein, partial [Isosphaeraceae bacterium]